MSSPKNEQGFKSFEDMGRALGRNAGHGRGREPAQRGGRQPPRPGPRGRAELQGYLRDGYFETSESGGQYLRVSLLTDTAQQIAEMLPGRMKTHQVRRFFNHVRALEGSLRNGAEFVSIVPELAKLEPAAANAVTRGLAPPEFQTFIEQNAREARKSENHFRKGFVPHFEAVVAYLPRDGR